MLFPSIKQNSKQNYRNCTAYNLYVVILSAKKKTEINVRVQSKVCYKTMYASSVLNQNHNSCHECNLIL